MVITESRKTSGPVAASEIMTVLEVAQALRCSKAHVHNLIGGRVRGLNPLPAIHLGRRSLVRRESLAAWLELNESKIGMIRSSQKLTPQTHERTSIMRRRYQEGSLKKVDGKWIAQWWEDGHRR